GRRGDARSAFARALAESEVWLQKCGRNPSAWSGKGLSLAGMAACGETTAIPKSVEAYQRSRDLDGGLGAIAVRKGLFLQLTKAAPECSGLRLIEPAISGEDRLTIPVPPDTRGQIFVSYAHEDKPWLDRLLKIMAPLTRNKVLEVWYDEKIKPGAKWREEISQTLKGARLGVLLVSPDFCASEFIAREELPFLLRAAEEERVPLFWVLVGEWLYKEMLGR